jgi:hypothetical protein
LDKLRIEGISWTPVAHTYKPSYSGDRDQEDCSSKLAQANSLQDPISKKKKTFIRKKKKRADGMTQSVGPEFKPQYHKKRERTHFNKIMAVYGNPIANMVLNGEKLKAFLLIQE